MSKIIEIVTISSVAQIPSSEIIRKLPRERTLKLVFEKAVQNKREETGQRLKTELPGFQVGIHLNEPVINITKLITDQEIKDHQCFFEKCAQDYRILSQHLIFELADKCGIEIDNDSPMDSFYELMRSKKQTGWMDDWRYFLHGIHCGFEHSKTKQTIEVCLVYGLEFGDLDPYFFSQYIKSTPQYKPLPIEIYEDYADGFRIIEQMLLLGKFKKLNGSNGFRGAVVVSNLPKVGKNTLEELTMEKTKTKFNLLRFFGLK